MKFKKDQKVWIYNGRTLQTSTIIDKPYDISLWRHRPDNLSQAQCRSDIEDNIFAYPEDRLKLINKIYDDKYYLQELIADLEREESK
jgi:hypothetical protein